MTYSILKSSLKSEINDKGEIRYERKEKATIEKIKAREEAIAARADRLSNRKGVLENALETSPSRLLKEKSTKAIFERPK